MIQKLNEKAIEILSRVKYEIKFTPSTTMSSNKKLCKYLKKTIIQ